VRRISRERGIHGQPHSADVALTRGDPIGGRGTPKERSSSMNQPANRQPGVWGHAFPQMATLPHEAMPSTSRQVCIIDDSPTVRAIVRTSLGRIGYHVRECADGVEAFHWLRSTRDPLPVLFVLDLNLPHMDGYSVARFLKHHPSFAAIPILILTGRDGVLDRLKARLVGAEAYLTKPFQTQGLQATVQSLLGPASPPEERSDWHVVV
jgi:twitching motility two-component system response regulator PilG